jgi:hypothetical protein
MRTVHGTRKDAETALARLKVADHQKHLPQAATKARSVGALLAVYLDEAVNGKVRLAPKAIVTVGGQHGVCDCPARR